MVVNYSTTDIIVTIIHAAIKIKNEQGIKAKKNRIEKHFKYSTNLLFLLLQIACFVANNKNHFSVFSLVF